MTIQCSGSAVPNGEAIKQCSGVPTIYETPATNPVLGKVALARGQFAWVVSMFAIAVIGGYHTFNWPALMVFLITSVFTLCFGHSLGMHRRFIHNSYECPKWLEYLFVHLGVLVGLAGPLGMMKTHDLRDWAQRQTDCHDYFAHRRGFWLDGFWQLLCRIELENPPTFRPPRAVSNDRVYYWMEKTWMWQQLPWTMLLFYFGGLPWAIWGVAVRVAVSVTGHWLVGYFAHNHGHRDWHVEGASVQGYNVTAAALFTFGECWHNNHHAFPGSAKFGLRKGQFDPGWWVLKALELVGLVWTLKTPEDLPIRPELGVPVETETEQLTKFAETTGRK